MNTAVEFLADMLHKAESAQHGYPLPMRWRGLRQELKKKYLAEALRLIEVWEADEERAEQGRKRK